MTSQMGFWTNKVHRTALDDAEDLAYAPSGGRIKMWLLGIALALVPFVYGVHCLLTGQARFFGSRGNLDLQGPAATALAIAYLAVGAFIHFHWFWGLHNRLEPFSYLMKGLATVVFLGGFGYTCYRLLN
jgi:hypothetical protein